MRLPTEMCALPSPKQIL